MHDRTESMRQLIEMAIQSGRKRQSSQTGYLHHYYTVQDDEPHVTIPVVENFLFALALLRSRTIENVTEAKLLLENLLHYQSRNGSEFDLGNFPIYIHEYPACKDRFTAVPISLAVYWILKLFHQVLGADLKQRLENSFSDLLKHILRTHAERAASYPIALKIGAVCQKGGEILKRPDLKAAGANIIEQLIIHVDEMAWCCPATMGTMLSALTLLHPKLSESPWKLFWKHLQDTWHPGTCCYVGPAIKEWQDGKEPQVTPYDLFMGYYNEGFSTRALKDSIVHLEAVLISPSEDKFNEVSYPHYIEGVLGNISWQLYKNKKLAYCYIKNNPALNPAFIKGFHPLRIVWGDKQRVHTFVCQGGNSKTISINKISDGVDIIFELSDVIESEDREKNRETVFFVDLHEHLEMFIAGHKATTFSFGEELLLRSNNCEIALTFHLQEGEGRFLGHRMLGNRPSQVRLKGKQRYDAYDWQLFMRTIKRSEHCVIKASIHIKEESLNI